MNTEHYGNTGGDTSRIIINDIKFFGYHGVYPEEAVIGTKFSIDLDIILAPGLQCFQNDNIECALNYETVTRESFEICTTRKYKLIECLAQAVADSILTHPEAASVTVTIHKLCKTLAPEPQWVAVQVTRHRHK